MKKGNLILSLALGTIGLCLIGCSSYSYTSRSTSINEFTVQSNSPAADVEIDYKHKVTASSDYQKFPAQAKQNALYKCILENNIDVVVDPIFQMEQRGMSNYRATIHGFAGYYKEGKTGIDATVEKKYTKEDIEKYLLLTDPSFYQYYYAKDKGNVYNIKTTAAPAKLAPVIQQPAKVAKPAKEKKAGKAGGFFSMLSTL